MTMTCWLNEADTDTGYWLSAAGCFCGAFLAAMAAEAIVLDIRVMDFLAFEDATLASEMDAMISELGGSVKAKAQGTFNWRI